MPDKKSEGPEELATNEPNEKPDPKPIPEPEAKEPKAVKPEAKEPEAVKPEAKEPEAKEDPTVTEKEIEALGGEAPPPNLDLGYRSSSDPEIEQPEAEDQETDIGSLFDRIKSRVKTEVSSDKPKRKPTKKEAGELTEAARTFLAPMLILAVGQSLGAACKPTEEEAEAVVEPLARIIARHVPVPEHLSADLVDLLAITAAVAAWYLRVQSNLPWNDGDGGNGRGPTNGPRPRSPNGHHQAEDLEQDVEATRENGGRSVQEFMSNH